jgi:hypothetical protein
VTRYTLAWLALLAAPFESPHVAQADDGEVARARVDDAPIGALDQQTRHEPSWTVPSLHATGLFVTLRLSEAYLYPDPFAETRWSVIGGHYREAFTRPPKFDASRSAFEWDGDPWYINVVGHALLGSELYLRARTCGHGVLGSVTFTAAGAVVWDYAFEGSGVRPSALDLVYTPASGLVLGELRYWLWSEADVVKAPVWRQVLRSVFDPFGEAERWAGTPC